METDCELKIDPTNRIISEEINNRKLTAAGLKFRSCHSMKFHTRKVQLLPYKIFGYFCNCQSYIEMRFEMEYFVKEIPFTSQR